MKSKKLTIKQEAVYKFMQNSFIANHRLPTMKEIAVQFGYKSPNAAHQTVEYICKKGFLIRVPTGKKSCVHKFAKLDASLKERELEK